MKAVIPIDHAHTGIEEFLLGDMGLQALSLSCHAGHDPDHLKYQIISSSMRISKPDNGFTRYYSA